MISNLVENLESKDWFIYNEYSNLYFSLIENAINEKRIKLKGSTYECHHIVPECLGGSRKKDNLVLLSPLEHFKVHFYLTKFTEGKIYLKMFYALRKFNMRLNSLEITEKELDECSKLFEKERNAGYKAISESKKGIVPFIWTDNMKIKQQETRKRNLVLGITSPIKRTPEQLENYRNAQLGKTMSIESSIKKSKALKGRKLSSSHKEKISKSHLGKHIYKENRKIFCIELNKLFDSVSIASKELNIPRSTIINLATRQSIRSSSGFHFRWND